MIEASFLWCWDARPYPAFPAREDVWADGAAWRLGHWLTGRVGLSNLSEVVTELCMRAGVEADVSGLRGVVSGFVADGPTSVGMHLEPLMAAFDFAAAERGGVVTFFHRDDAVADIAASVLTQASAARPFAKRGDAAQTPIEARVRFLDAMKDYRIASVSARRLDRAEGGVESVDAPLVLEPAAAEAMAQAPLSDRRAAAESLDVEVGPAQLALEPGDLVRFDGGATYLIARIEDTEARRMELRRARDATAPDLALPEPAPPSPPADSPTPVLAVLDLPALPGVEDDDRPLAAVFAAPWRGQHEVFAGPEDALMTRRAIVRRAAIMGELVWALWPGPVGRWDRGNRMRVRIFDGALSSASAAAVLAGANVFAIQNGGEWEIVQARDCVLVSDGEYVFSGLLRGQAGSAHAMAAPHPIGARIIKLDERLARLEIGAHEWREALPFAAPPSGALPSDARAARSEIILPHAGLRPRAPAHLRARKLTGGDIRLSWVRCARIGGDAWGPGEPSLGPKRRDQANGRGLCAVLDL